MTRISPARRQATLERLTRAGHLPPQVLAEFTRQPGICMYPEDGATELHFHPRNGFVTAEIPMCFQNRGPRPVTIEDVEFIVNGVPLDLPVSGSPKDNLNWKLQQKLVLKPNGGELHEVLSVSGWAPPELGAKATCCVIVYFTNGRDSELSIMLPVVRRKNQLKPTSPRASKGLFEKRDEPSSRASARSAGETISTLVGRDLARQKPRYSLSSLKSMGWSALSRSTAPK